MIRVVHNSVDRAVETGDCENLAEVLERSGRNCAEVPHLFTQIRIDGSDLPEDSYDRLCEISIEGVQEIELESRPTVEIALSSLRHSRDYVAAIRTASDRVAGLFRTGRSEEANELLAHLSDSLGVLVTAISGVAGALPQVSEVLLAPMSELIHWLDQVLVGQSSGDWVQVADILEYELDPRLEQWARTMERVGQQERQGVLQEPC